MFFNTYNKNSMTSTTMFIDFCIFCYSIYCTALKSLFAFFFVYDIYPSDIIYVESMSNYANVYYLEDEEVRKRSLRITMKQMKTTLADYDYLVSCHRAFLVNLNYVQSMKGRPSTGFELQMFGSDKTIPVSRTYSEDFKNQVTK